MVIETPFHLFRFVLVTFVLLYLVTLLLSLALHGVYARASSARTRENAQHAHRLVELNRAYKLLRPHRRELAEIGVYALVLLGLVIAHF